jgi:hypothetical protein
LGVAGNRPITFAALGAGNAVICIDHNRVLQVRLDIPGCPTWISVVARSLSLRDWSTELNRSCDPMGLRMPRHRVAKSGQLRTCQSAS